MQIAGPRGQTKTKICKSYQASSFGVWRWWGRKEEMSWDAFGDGRRPGLWFLVSAFTLAKSVEEPVYWYSSIPIYWYTHLSVYQYTSILVYPSSSVSCLVQSGPVGSPDTGMLPLLFISLTIERPLRKSGCSRYVSFKLTIERLPKTGMLSLRLLGLTVGRPPGALPALSWRRLGALRGASDHPKIDPEI